MIRTAMTAQTHDNNNYDLTLVMPCYNEEEIVQAGVRDLIDAFSDTDFRIELITVDNGSTDRTTELLLQLQDEFPEIQYVRVEHNIGYGDGVLAGLPRARGRWVGTIPADQAVDPRDVVTLFTIAARSAQPRLFKIRRRYRLEGPFREFQSTCMNLGLAAMFRLGTMDVNAGPKIFPRECLPKMDLQERRWFLETEILIKAKRIGLPIVELNAFGRAREGGHSHVKPHAVWDVLQSAIKHRLGVK